MVNQNPEQRVRDKIDNMLEQAGRSVQDKDTINFNAAIGIAVREYQTEIGLADYVLFIDHRLKALIQMAIGSGKTYTAITFIDILLKYVDELDESITA